MVDVLGPLPGLVGQGLFGLALATAVTAVVRALTHRYARHSMLGFGGNGVDVVLPASDPRGVATGGVTRPTTGKGSVQAMGEVARAVGRYYGKLRFTVHVATLEGPLTADLVCIGGPRANEVTRKLFATSRIRDIPGFAFDDVTFSLTVTDRVESTYDLEIGADGVPGRDLAVVISTANPYQPSNRAIICCGFSSYGTRGAAEWFFGDVMAEASRKPWARPYGVPRGDEPWIAVLDFQVTGGRVMCTDRSIHTFRTTA